MLSAFDILTFMLFVGATGMFLLRLRHETPPASPFAIVFAVAAVGNWMGENGGGAAAIALLIAGAFLLLHVASLPYPEETD